MPEGSVHARRVGSDLYREDLPVIEPKVEVVHPQRSACIARAVLAAQQLLQQLGCSALLGGHVGERLSVGDDLSHLVVGELHGRHGYHLPEPSRRGALSFERPGSLSPMRHPAGTGCCRSGRRCSQRPTVQGRAYEQSQRRRRRLLASQWATS